MNPPKVLCVRTVEDSLLGSDIQPYCFSFLITSVYVSYFSYVYFHFFVLFLPVGFF